MEKKNPGNKAASAPKRGVDDQVQAGKKVQNAVRDFTDNSSVIRDPYGSYTGRPKDNGGLEQPVQDADDL